MSISFTFLFLAGLLSSDLASPPVCRNEFEETFCENFMFSPEILLSSDANKLVIKNASGTITKENLSNLKTVSEIIITESEIAEFQPGALCSVENLTSITISNDKKIPKITKDVLKGCQQLKKIFVDGAVVENEAFEETGDLHTLTLNNTVLPDVIEEETFRGLESLKSLTITHSNVRKIEEDAFEDFKNLKFLDLQGNKIVKIETKTFWGLSELKVLNLADNHLKNLTWDEFKNLKSLMVLFLERNYFDYVDIVKLVKEVPELERIFLSYDKLSPENIKIIDETLKELNKTVIYSEKM